MVNADSDEGERSSERSDGCRSVSFHLDTHGSSLSYSLWCTCTKRDEGLWSLWAALAPSKEGWETRAPSARVSRLCRGVFHASGRIHRPGASRRPPRMPQERRARPRATSNSPPFAAAGRCAVDHASGLAVVFGAAFVRRIEGPVSSRRWASCSSRSQIASAWLGSPMPACQSVAGSWLAIRVEPRSARSSIDPPPRVEPVLMRELGS